MDFLIALDIHPKEAVAMLYHRLIQMPLIGHEQAGYGLSKSKVW